MSPINLLLGVWHDTAAVKRVAEPKTYVITQLNAKIKIEVYGTEGNWKFGGTHLMRLTKDGAVWGAQVDRYFCKFADIARTKTVRWFKCGNDEIGRHMKPMWEWSRNTGTSPSDSWRSSSRIGSSSDDDWRKTASETDNNWRSATIVSLPPVLSTAPTPPPSSPPPSPPPLLIMSHRGAISKYTFSFLIGVDVYTASEYDDGTWQPAQLIKVTDDDFIVGEGSHKWAVDSFCVAK